MAGPDLLEIGIYTIPEVAELVDAPQADVRIWVEGRKGLQDPVIQNQLGRVGGKTAVSFANLMELRFVARFANAGVRLNEIRKIMNEVRELIRHPHPFATNTVFKTDGRKIVAEIARKHGLNLVYDLHSKNYEMQSVILKSLKENVVFNLKGEAVEWTPRPDIAPNVIVHPRIAFGHPVLRRSRIPTETIAKAVKVEGSAG
ncbi:MAG: hypothetical protein ACOZAA_14470, partial [Pseudomonadota bacterium]